MKSENNIWDLRTINDHQCYPEKQRDRNINKMLNEKFSEYRRNHALEFDNWVDSYFFWSSCDDSEKKKEFFLFLINFFCSNPEYTPNETNGDFIIEAITDAVPWLFAIINRKINCENIKFFQDVISVVTKIRGFTSAKFYLILMILSEHDEENINIGNIIINLDRKILECYGSDINGEVKEFIDFEISLSGIDVITEFVSLLKKAASNGNDKINFKEIRQYLLDEIKDWEIVVTAEELDRIIMLGEDTDQECFL